MNGQDLFKKLRRRLEEASDATDSDYSASEKLDAFEVALRTVVMRLAQPYLTPLLKLQSAASTDETFTITQVMAPDSIISVLVKSADNYKVNKYAEIVKLAEKEMINNNSYFKPEIDAPIAYITHPTSNNGDIKITVSPTSGVNGIDVLYVSEPTAITDSAEMTYQLSEETVAPLLDLAEAELWRIDNQMNRANIAMQKGIGELELLNQRYNPQV